MIIRKAEQKDLQQLLDIYNYEVEYGTATFDIHPKTLEQWQVWFDQHNVGNHPLIVAEKDGKAAGYASLSSYREKEAYHTTVELSVYIAPDCRRQGVASALMEEILNMARQDEEIHMVISVITSGNADSIRLHDKFGFTYCGSLHDVGIKFDRYLSISNYELKV